MLRIHPNLAELYRQKVAALEEALNRPEDRDEAHAALRGLVDQVIIHPGAARGEGRAELYGEFASILELMESKNKTLTSRDVRVSLVAGARNQRYLPLTQGRVSPLISQAVWIEGPQPP